MSNPALHTYRIFGLSVRSEIALPELDSVADDAAADVIISVFPPDLNPAADFQLTASGDEVSLRVPRIATFRMRGGRTIAVAAEPNASKRDVRLFLLGSAFAAVFHQRDLLPLHSNAIEVDGKAIAFLGHSGAGKSTLAAWFHDRGHGMLSDDVCVVGVDGHGVGVAYGGVPRVRLWRDALEASGRSAASEERAADQWDKYNIRTNRSATAQEVTLSHIYVFAGDGSEVETVVRRLSGSRAVQALVEHTYRGAYVKLLDKTKSHLDQCVGLAQKLAIFEVRRPWGLAVLDQVGATLESHARAFMQSPGLLDPNQTFLG